MGKKIWTLIIKEILAVWRDKKSRMTLIVPPILQLCIFAFAATLDVNNVSIGIYNRDSGRFSHELIQRISGSPTFTRVYLLKSTASIKEAVDTQKVMAVVHFDDTFSKDILAGKPSPVQIILDGRKSNSAQIVQGYIARIIDQYNQDLKSEYNLPEKNFPFVIRNWFNPNLIYIWFTVPSLIGLLVTLVTLAVTGLSVARERELGTFEQLLVSPLQPFEILIGKALPAVIIGMIEATVIIFAAVFIFRIPFTGSLLLVYPSLFVFTLAIAGIGLFISSLSTTQQQAILGIFVFMSPAVTLSGFATPIENMPSWLQPVTLANPLRHFLVIIRGLFLQEMSPSLVFQSTYPMVIIAIFTLAGASWLFRKRIE